VARTHCLANYASPSIARQPGLAPHRRLAARSALNLTNGQRRPEPGLKTVKATSTVATQVFQVRPEAAARAPPTGMLPHSKNDERSEPSLLTERRDFALVPVERHWLAASHKV